MRKTPEERFWDKVNKNGPIPTERPDLGPCWVWISPLNKMTGYGQFSVGGAGALPHRYSWQLHFGNVPDEARVIQLCRNTACVNPSHLKSQSESERFFENVVRNDQAPNCWEWIGALANWGYGLFGTHGDSVRAHRWMWQFVRWPITDTETKVLHRCDNPRCVNPFHHFSGTIQENVDDMVSKGRDRKAKGEERPDSKLTDEKVREIRRDYIPRVVSMRMLARKYSVSHVVIKMVVLGRTWKHVT